MNQPTDSKPSFETAHHSQNMSLPRRFVQLVFIGIVLLVFYPFLMPMALAAVFASLLWPFMQWKWPYITSQGAKAFTLTMGFTLLILGPVLTLIGGGILAIQNKVKEGAFQNMEIDPGGLLKQFLTHERVILLQETLHISDTQVKETFFSGLMKIQYIVVDFLQSLLTSIPNTAMAFVIMVLCLYFLLKEYRYLLNFIHRYSPVTEGQTKQLVDTFRGASISVVMAGILSGSAQSIVIGTGAAVTGLGNPMIVAMISFVGSFFPFIGTGLVSVTLITIGLIKGDTSDVVLFLPFAAFSSLVDNIVYPVVVGSRAHLNPLISFVAVIGGVSLFGLFGIFLGPIVVILSFKILELITEGKLSPPKEDTDSDDGIGRKVELWVLKLRSIFVKKHKRPSA